MKRTHITSQTHTDMHTKPRHMQTMVDYIMTYYILRKLILQFFFIIKLVKK